MRTLPLISTATLYRISVTIKIDSFKLNNSFHYIMPHINLTTDCHVAIGIIVHCWEVVKRDIVGHGRKSGGRVLLTGFGLKFGAY